MFDGIDFKDCTVLSIASGNDLFQEDLLRLECPNGRQIHAGWCGDDAGFCVKVVSGEGGEKPFYQLYKHKPEGMEQDLQKFILYETASFPEEIAALYQKLRRIVETGKGNPKPVLRDLCAAGLSQDEVENYLGTYALQFYRRDKGKWNQTCDLLDLVNGFCSPKDRIWRPEPASTPENPA